MDDVYEIPVRDLRKKFGDPMRRGIWGCDPFSKHDVLASIKLGRLDDRPWDGRPGSSGIRSSYESSNCRDYHVARVAYMVVNRQEQPIALEIHCPLVGLYKSEVYDGNHRFAAAIVRRDKSILCTFGGGVEEFFEMFRSAMLVAA